jgi:hypothetical protein
VHGNDTVILIGFAEESYMRELALFERVVAMLMKTNDP